MAYSYLALGDSYTIGEGVPLHESFPYLLVQMLRNEGLPFLAPEIVAKTGWTTGELMTQIAATTFHTHYNFVTLLIGVNNQYRGLSISDYENDFKDLLQQSITLAKEKSGVIVLSIPHWEFTPFAQGREIEKIEKEINHFNEINKNISLSNEVHYIDISSASKEVLQDPSLITSDNLHYSVKTHIQWAKKVAAIIQRVIAIDG